MSRLEEDRMRDPATITYYVCVDRAKPGRLFFCYHTGAKYGLSVVTCATLRVTLKMHAFSRSYQIPFHVTPDGLKLLDQVFRTPAELVKYFKANHKTIQAKLYVYLCG